MNCVVIVESIIKSIELKSRLQGMDFSVVYTDNLDIVKEANSIIINLPTNISIIENNDDYRLNRYFVLSEVGDLLFKEGMYAFIVLQQFGKAIGTVLYDNDYKKLAEFKSLLNIILGDLNLDSHHYTLEGLYGNCFALMQFQVVIKNLVNDNIISKPVSFKDLIQNMELGAVDKDFLNRFLNEFFDIDLVLDTTPPPKALSNFIGNFILGGYTPDMNLKVYYETAFSVMYNSLKNSNNTSVKTLYEGISVLDQMYTNGDTRWEIFYIVRYLCPPLRAFSHYFYNFAKSTHFLEQKKV